MKQQYRILLVDDHLITLEAYRGVLELMSQEFIFTEAQSIDEALEKAERQPQLLPFDMAFVDIHLPRSESKKIESGEGLALELKKKFTELKIVIPTQYNQPERIRYIIDKVNPDALLLKEEFRSAQICRAVEIVLSGGTYYSSKVELLLRKDHLQFDDYDLKILSCIARGVKIKDIENHVPLSSRAIEDRKSMLMIKLGVPPRNNEQLIAIAREKGLI
ncbi:response regulator transcription factor [Chryseobacterium limigenitum]|uniref:DNA-binding response regulator, NarL/FixJ family, contains REC and HTH domains n=1 Tax=Chryseobacterium limigenitum TaxID=1612149 RepID=A0A1K2IS30_9FLAO|nr:response regulator transcription factor [Chryseobacterium limigenitum]SFZ95245.1 DNA-binding response regulator, NarL/FixJ family, contains REC and HTH domains [Chryseobacterium limigenitum]